MCRLCFAESASSTKYGLLVSKLEFPIDILRYPKNKQYIIQQEIKVNLDMFRKMRCLMLCFDNNPLVFQQA